MAPTPAPGPRPPSPDEESIVQHGVLQEGLAFLQKPFGSEMLGRKIQEALGRSGGVTPR